MAVAVMSDCMVVTGSGLQHGEFSFVNFESFNVYTIITNNSTALIGMDGEFDTLGLPSNRLFVVKMLNG